MRDRLLHPSLRRLLLFADGELSSFAAARVRSHIAACPECGQRVARIEAASGNFAEAQHGAALPIADIAGPRALLKARMAESERYPSGAGYPLRIARSLAYACALVVLVAAGYVALQQRHGPQAPYARLRPDPAFTPGLTRAVSLADLCVADHDEVVREVPAALQQRVLGEYGIKEMPSDEYEVDYLITPGLGGADDVKNLWPQPHGNTRWNSYVKDQLEDHLHGMVCDGQLSLQMAQRDIATDWIAAYKKYFHTEVPMTNALNAELSERVYFSTILWRKHPWE
jgi:anti-sigma factor RsiW